MKKWLAGTVIIAVPAAGSSAAAAGGRSHWAGYYEDERVVGYDVRYQYDGRVYHTRMDRDPGPRVRARVNATVVE